MYYILDLRTAPPTEIPDLVFETEFEACDWINLNGDATIYTFTKRD